MSRWGINPTDNYIDFIILLKEIMVGEFIQYCIHVRWLSEKTIKCYNLGYKAFSKFMLNLWKDINDPTVITIDNVNQFIIWERLKWNLWRSVNSKLFFLRKYLWYCKYIKDMDVLEPQKIIPCKREDTKIWYHTEEKRKKILDLVNKWYWRTKETMLRNKLMVYLLLYTGLRVWEMNLKTDDIHKTTQIIGKWRKHRFIYIKSELMDMINNYIDKRKYKWEYLFNTKYKWKINKLSTQTIEKMFERMWEKLWFRVNPHSFRHTYATELLKTPWCSIYDIATLLWHKDISSTAIYLGVDSKHLMDVQFSLKY